MKVRETERSENHHFWRHNFHLMLLPQRSLMNLILTETRVPKLHCCRCSIGLSSLCLWWAPKNVYNVIDCILPFKVIQDHWFRYQLKVRFLLLISDHLQLWAYLVPFRGDPENFAINLIRQKRSEVIGPYSYASLVLFLYSTRVWQTDWQTSLP